MKIAHGLTMQNGPQPVTISGPQPVTISAEQVIITDKSAVKPIHIAQTGMVVIPTTSAGLASNLACISLLCGPIFAIPALLIALNAEKITSQYPNHPDAKNVKNAKILATVSLVFTVLYLFFMVTRIGMSSQS